MPPSLRLLLAGALCAAGATSLSGQSERLPTARLVRASRIVMPGAVDSNVPLAWELVDGRPRLFALTSFAGEPARHTGPALDQMQQAGPVALVQHPGDGIWIESVVPDDHDTWYGYYHHERNAGACGRGDRFIPRIGAARSTDRGATWEHLGFILEAPSESVGCTSTNRYVLGGVGDLSAALDGTKTFLFLYFSQYSKTPAEQGIAAARLAWADRDAPVGRLDVWHGGAWIPGAATGTPLVAPTRPWHDRQVAADAFWGPSIHWNHYLERYVMLMNHAANERFDNEGIYVSYARRLDDPRLWSRPRKIFHGGGWYPQVAGLETGTGTDREAGQRARFLLTGRSDYFIDFTK